MLFKNSVNDVAASNDVVQDSVKRVKQKPETNIRKETAQRKRSKKEER